MKKIIKYLLSKIGIAISKADPSTAKYQWYYNAALMKRRYVPRTCKFEGQTLYTHDYISFVAGVYDLFQNDILKFKADNDSPYIIDCGANIGMSVLYFKMLYPNSTVVAFEADPLIFSYLEKNMKSCKFSKVQTINRAVWNSSDEILSFMSEGGVAGRIQEKLEGFTMVDVKTVRLKDFLDRPVDFLKIDIEGAEYTVIQDCREKLPNVQNLFIEYHSFYDTEQHLDSLLAIVKDAGFRYHLTKVHTSRQPFVERELNLGMDLQLNVFCYRG